MSFVSRAVRRYLAPTPLALAHRGGALYGPNVGLENTLTAFRNAIDLGYTYIETDVRLTKDGRLVVFHDDRLDRVTNASGPVAELRWSQIREARFPSGEPVPLLVDVLDAFPGINLNIDLKSPGTAAAVWELVRHRGLHDRICVGSFSPRSITHFRFLSSGEVATAASPVGTAMLAFGPQWLSRLLATPADVLQIPSTTVVRGRRVELVTERLVETAHALGKHVHVWTIDDADEIHELLDLGVDGIVSDRIDVLKDVLVERGSWEQG